MGTKRISTISIFIMLAGVSLILVSGCASAKYQKEVVQPMMIQENRQLEDELFFTREQLKRSRFENQQLRKQIADLQSATPSQVTKSSKKTMQESSVRNHPNAGTNVGVNANSPTPTAGIPVWAPQR